MLKNMAKPKVNKPCPCGSDKKYKKCCMTIVKVKIICSECNLEKKEQYCKACSDINFLSRMFIDGFPKQHIINEARRMYKDDYKKFLVSMWNIMFRRAVIDLMNCSICGYNIINQNSKNYTQNEGRYGCLCNNCNTFSQDIERMKKSL